MFRPHTPLVAQGARVFRVENILYINQRYLMDLK